ncbi:MAG TPA: tetratricopeptide repeat protein [Syntrophales bacterium]|nr:tetratricopeptide repeat protein [Syntrophales bacterium]
MESSFRRRKPEEPKRPGRRLLIAGIAGLVVTVLVLAWIIANYAFPGKMYKYPASLVRLKNTFSFVFLGHKPEFYYMDVEKNGTDYRLKKGDALDVSYRDEFVVKDVATDVLSGGGVTVHVDDLAGTDHFRVMLRGVDLVDKVVMTRGKGARDAGASVITVKYKGEVIASVPIKVAIMPQDWLRYAKNSQNQQGQIEYLKRAIDMNKKDIGVRKTLVAIYEQTGVTDKAIAQYNEILSLKPDDTDALSGLLKCYIKTRDYDKAIKVGMKLLKKNPRDASAFANIAYAYGSMGAWRKAIINYKESLQLNPDDTMVRFKLGEAYEKENDLRNAVEQYKIVLAKARETEHVKVALAGAYLRAGNYDESIRLYKEILTKQPRNATAYANLGLAYGGKGQWKEEIENYKKSISLNPKDPVVHYNLASAYEKGNQDQEAQREYQTLLKINPGDIESATKLADMDFKNKRYNEAIRAYEKILKSSPGKASIHANLGFAYGELKKYKLSAEHYEKAIKYGMKDSQVRYNLAYTYDKLGRKKEAIRQYEYVASSHPSMDVLDILAEYYTDDRQYDNAIKTYKKMIVMNPKKGTAYSGLGYVYGLKNDIDKEIEYYRISLKYDAEDDDVYLGLGKAYEKKGMYQDALKAYINAYELNPDSALAAKKIPALKIKILQQKHGGS